MMELLLEVASRTGARLIPQTHRYPAPIYFSFLKVLCTWRRDQMLATVKEEEGVGNELPSPFR